MVRQLMYLKFLGAFPKLPSTVSQSDILCSLLNHNGIDNTLAIYAKDSTFISNLGKKLDTYVLDMLLECCKIVVMHINGRSGT